MRLDLFVCGFLAQYILVDSLAVSTEFGTLLGITGPIWYAIAAQMPIILFPIMLVRFRMIAPGARTFLHVVYGRFGRTAHILLCVLVLINNVSFIISVVDTGNEIFTTISNVNFGLVWIVNITIAGIFVSCARLRHAFIVSSVGAVFILISILAFFIGVFFKSSDANLGSIEKIYEANLAAKNLYDGDFNRLTLRNSYVLIRAFKKLFANTLLYMNQATWQSCSYAEPGEESLGVMISSVLWMAIPYAFGTACSAGFISLMPQKELSEMTPNEIVDTLCEVISEILTECSLMIGIAMPSVIIARALFGRNGFLLVFAMYAFLIANTSVFQLFSITSILTYDIYAIHIRPFRVCYDLNCCMLCGKSRDLTYRPKENCECIPVSCCEDCKRDESVRKAVKGFVKPPCKCRIHSGYIKYQECLRSVRHIIILLVLSGVLPMGILINGLALNESIGNILITAIGPLVYTFFWDGMTSKGIVIGTLLSTSLAALIRFVLSVLKRTDHAVFENNDVSNAVLYAIAITLGFVLPPLVVCMEKIWRKIKHESPSGQLYTAWARVYEMDNPLNPWALNYAKSFLFANFDTQSYSRPSFQEVKRAYRFSWYFALAGPFIFCFLFVGVMPMMFSIINVMDLVTFKAWIYVILVLLIVSTAVTIFLPIIFEVVNCYRLIRAKTLPSDRQQILPRIEYSEHQDDIEMESKDDIQMFPNFGITTIALAMHSTGASALTVSSYAAAQNGLTGPVWYLVGAATPISMMGILVTQYRSKAPGGETFPQFMLARFGKRVHLLFCCLTIINNMAIISAVVNTGCKFYSVISADVTFELAWIVTVIVAEICATVGTIKHLIPFSYIMFVYFQFVAMVIAIKVFMFDPTNTMGSFKKIYDAIVLADSNITEVSSRRLTMRSYLAMNMGISKLLAQTCEIVFDQSIWDTYAYFVPGEEGWGTLVTVLIWCSFPLVFGTSCGFGSILLQMSNNGISPDKVPTVEIAKSILGHDGLFVLFSLYAFMVTTATTLKIFSITKVLTMDLYAVHLRPFRVCFDVNCCTFCGKSKDDQTRPKDKCQCCDPEECIQCQEDKKAERIGYQDYAITCPIHSPYLRYTKALRNIHRSSVLLVLCVVVPIGLIINYFEICELLFSELPKNCTIGGLGSFILALYWKKLTEPAVFIGTLISSLLAIITWTILTLLKVHTSFKTDDDLIDAYASGVGLVSSFILPVLITFLPLRKKSRVYDGRKPELTWQRTLDLGNPVKPWTRTYSQVFQISLSTFGLISLEDVMKAMKPARLVAYIENGVYFGIIAILLGFGCIPAVFTLTDFTAWIAFLFVWLLLSILAALTLPIFSHFFVMKRFKISLKMPSLPHIRPPKISIENDSQ
ncbi:unnamed protein product [Hymenolepis diminuta]|uniref:Uncharacterized protein n=2 Tax=Hymenolepis diminuta TaxID=6216 RepID=A0A3P6XUM5_HYMDI|nr:unnamed protein product [Hymenolepis diminuta]